MTSLKQMVRLRRGSRILAMIIVIQHPDGSQVIVSPADIRNLQIDIETNFDRTTGAYHQSGHISFDFPGLMVIDPPPGLVAPALPDNDDSDIIIISE